MFGLVLFGMGIAMMVIADLGLSPWEVLHQGISRRAGIPIGTVSILTGIVVLLLWIPLGERVGIGTILNVFIIGIVMDLTLWIGPESMDTTWQRWVLLIGGVLLVGVGSGFYIGVGLGPGPRDGVMTGLARRGVHIGVARASIEISVLFFGWLLGGTVGIGTLLFAFGMGPLVALFLPRLSLQPLAKPVNGKRNTVGGRR
ncbi:MAG: membrane protein [Acidimicrobiia bacterium]|nr:MAG: membrane protein [Acidimicrobiia bacterium]